MCSFCFPSSCTPTLPSQLAFLQHPVPSLRPQGHTWVALIETLANWLLIHLKVVKTKSPSSARKCYTFSVILVCKFHPLFQTTNKTSPHDTKLPVMLSNYAFQNLCSFLLFGHHYNTSYPTEKELLVALEYRWVIIVMQSQKTLDWELQRTSYIWTLAQYKR